MKKFLGICLAAGMALALAACGDKPPESYAVEVVGPERTSAPAPSQDPQAATPRPGWLVAPRADLEITVSLAEYESPQQGTLTGQAQLAFFVQGGKTGVIDLQGNVRIPAEKDVHWCPVCGITNADESEIYDQNGGVVGSGGHGVSQSEIYYDLNSKQLYAMDMGWLFSWDQMQVTTAQPFIAQVAYIAPKEGEATPEDVYLDSTGEAVTVTQPAPAAYMLMMPGGQPLDNVQYEQVNGATEGLFATKKGGLWGFVNATTGQQAVPFVYSQVRPFREGLAAVQTGTGWGYVDTAGSETTVMTFAGAQTAAGGAAWVKTAEGWGVAQLSQWGA